MEYRQLGRTDMKVSAVSFGAWAIGGTWGPVQDDDSAAALPALDPATMDAVRKIYDERIRTHVHASW